MLQEYLLILARALAMLALAPLFLGITKKTKALLQNRRGPGLLQAYFDLYKFWQKEITLAPLASYIFVLAPPVFLATTFVGCLIVQNPSGSDVFVLLYFLAAGRFAMSAAALDTATTFGGMGASRELYVATLIEPTMLLAIIGTVSVTDTSLLGNMTQLSAGRSLSLPDTLAMLGFFMLILAENGRVPVDNPDTHLELTMIHEGMTLEYSGRLLALINLAAYTKQLIFYMVFAMLFMVGDFGLLPKMLLTAVMVGIAETLNNKIRLFRVPHYIVIAGAFIILSIVTRY